MGKPIIRHCKNCQYYEGGMRYDCSVRYIDIMFYRLRAWLCRFYKQKEE